MQAKVRDKASILASLPPDANRIYVLDEHGKNRYKKPSEIGHADQIVLNHEGEPIVMARRPGRPKKPEMPPLSDAARDMQILKEEHLKGDDLLGTVQDNPEAADVLDYVMQGLAEEAASLGFERLDAERRGKDTSGISTKRIGALKAVGDTWLKRKEQLQSTGVDLDSAAFARLFKFIMDTFRESMNSAGSRPEMIETVFTNLAKRIGDDEWRREATKRMTEE